MEVIGGISGVVSLIGCVGKLAKRINEYRDKYKNVSLYTTLAVTQLSTIRAALEAIAEWRLTSNEDTPATRKLDDVFAESLRGCAVLITVIDTKLGEANPDPGVKDKLKHLWIEDVLKEYMSNLEGQVQGLQLLLSIHHWFAQGLQVINKMLIHLQHNRHGANQATGAWANALRL